MILFNAYLLVSVIRKAIIDKVAFDLGLWKAKMVTKKKKEGIRGKEERDRKTSVQEDKSSKMTTAQGWYMHLSDCAKKDASHEKYKLTKGWGLHCSSLSPQTELQAHPLCFLSTLCSVSLLGLSTLYWKHLFLASGSFTITRILPVLFTTLSSCLPQALVTVITQLIFIGTNWTATKELTV